MNTKQLVAGILSCLWPDSPSEAPETIQTSAMFFMRDGWILYFGKEEARAFNSCLSQVLAHEPLTRRYSNKLIRSRFESLLVRLLTTYETRPEEEAVKRQFSSWIKEMLAATDHDFEYFAIIDNLQVKRERHFGKVKFEPVSDSTIERITSIVFDQVDRNPNYTDEEKARLKERLYEDSLSELEADESKCLASVILPTKDADKGLELANQRIGEVLDLLRFLGAFVFRLSPRRPIGLQGEVPPQRRFNVAVSTTGGFRLLHQALSFPFELSTANARQFRKLGLPHFDGILSKDPGERTDLEGRLVSAIHWSAEAIQETSDAARFLKFCISLESLLCTRNEEPIGATIGERLAFLLESNKDRRLSVFQQFKKIYRVRSRLAHGDLAKLEDDLGDLLPYVFAFSIHAVVRVSTLTSRSAWDEFEQLRGYLEDLKFK